MYTSRYGPYTAVYSTSYTVVYGRVDGRFRPCRWPVHGRVHVPCTRRHVDTCTRPYTFRVHGPCARPVHSRVHVPCTGPCTRAETGRRRPCRRPVHSHVYGWCRRAVCTAHTRPCTGRVYATAVIPPCTGRFRGRRRVHGPYTQPPCNGHTTRYTAVYTARTRPCDCRVDFPCMPYTWRCNGCVHVSPAHGPCTCCGRAVYTAVYMALTFPRPVHGDNSASR